MKKENQFCSSKQFPFFQGFNFNYLFITSAVLLSFSHIVNAIYLILHRNNMKVRIVFYED